MATGICSTLAQYMARCLTASLPEPMLTYRQWGPLAFTWGQYRKIKNKKRLKIKIKQDWKQIFKIASRFPSASSSVDDNFKWRSLAGGGRGLICNNHDGVEQSMYIKDALTYGTIVEYRNNAVQYNTIFLTALRWVKQNINQRVKSQITPHIST